MQEIREWLQNPVYEVGVRLYQQYGSNSFLKQKFAAGIGDYNVKKLRDEMERISDVGSASGRTSWSIRQSADKFSDLETKSKGFVEQKAESLKPKAAIEPKAETPSSDKVEADRGKYLGICKTRDRLYRELDALMSERHHLPEGEKLLKCAERIVLTNQQITECWEKIDFWTENGYLPDEPVKPNIDPKKEIQLLRQAISKANSRLKNPTCREREQTQKLIETSKARIAELKAKINAAE